MLIWLSSRGESKGGAGGKETDKTFLKEVSRVVKAARETITTAKKLQHQGLILRHNVAMVQEAMNVVIDALLNGEKKAERSDRLDLESLLIELEELMGQL